MKRRRHREHRAVSQQRQAKRRDEAALPPPVEDLHQEPAQPETAICDRLLTYDSVFWRCGCGATGRVGRTSEGMPAIDAAVRRHPPGERLVALPPSWSGQYVLSDHEPSKGV